MRRPNITSPLISFIINMPEKNPDVLEISKTPGLINNERVMLSSVITKYNDLGFRQERILVITENAIYNIRRKNVQRRLPIEKLEALSISTMSSEFVLHIKEEYDYRLLSYERRQEIIESILNVVCNIKQLATSFPIYYVPMINLNSIMTTHSLFKQKKTNRPAKNYLTIMNLEKFHDNEKKDEERKTELRKRTTVLFEKGKGQAKDICIEDFELLKVLGKGAFGKVMLAQKKDNKRIYAIKVLKKQEIIEQDQLEHTKAEKLILSHVNHPFLVGLEYAFQTPEKLYFVMEFMQGGELFQHLRTYKRFGEDQAKFYAACITLGLGHLHNKNYIYRDLKLENLLLDEHGYAKLTDFGLAKFLKSDEKALTFCGTPEYLSPEVILGKGHNRPADWWSLGVLIYEMMFGVPPFYSSNVQLMYKKAVREPVVFKPGIKISDEAKDIINKLLTKDANTRLGAQADSLEVLSHPWFKDLDWSKLLERKLKAPFVPEVSGDAWLKNFDEEFTREKARDSVVKVDLSVLKEFQAEFEELNFNKDNDAQGDKNK